MIPVVIATEAEVMRYGWFGDRWVEILDCSPDAIVLTRATDYMPLFVNHDPSDQVGAHQNVRIEGKQLVGDMRFSRNQRAQDMRNDVVDGIRPKTSVGYFVHEMVLERQDNESGIDYYRVTKWEPVENSLAGIPADPSAGTGRSANPEKRAVVVRSRISPSNPGASPKEIAMKDENNGVPGSGAPDLRVIRAEGETAERERVGEINSYCDLHEIDRQVRNKLIEEGTSIRDARKVLADEMRKRLANPTPQAVPVELNAKERKRYSIARAIVGQVNRDGKDKFTVDGVRVDDGFEHEIQQDLEKKLPETYTRRGGVLVPTFTSRQALEDRMTMQAERVGRAVMGLSTRAGLDSKTSTKGAELVFTQPGEFIDLLRNAMKLRALGARVLSGLTGPVSFIKQTGAGSTSWVGENPGGDVADSNLLLSLVTLSPKTLMSSTSYSRQLLVSALSASIDAANMVDTDLALDMALAADATGLTGTGASNDPTGIINTSGINVVALGTNGAAPSYGNMVDLETAVSDANVPTDACAYLTNAVMRGKLKQTLTFPAANTGQPIWTPDGEVNGYRAEVSKQSPRLLTKGTSTDCHAIFFAAWNQAVFGEWGVMELIPDPLRLKKQGMIEVTAFQMLGFCVRYPEAFAVIKDARNI